MCYYNGIRVTREQYIELLERDKLLEAINIGCRSGFDWSDFPIVKPKLNNDWDFEMAHWEFIPSWIYSKSDMADHRKKYVTLNAKGETILSSKMFRESALSKRCLVLSTGFFEWRHYKDEGKETTYPYYIGATNDTEEHIFFMAGIYNETVDSSTGEVITSFAIVTTVANGLMEQIHNTKKRMPTILPKNLAEEWISDISEERIKEIATYQYSSEEMFAWTVAKDFKTSENPTLEFEYPELPVII